jgi:hypothetical protein
MDSSYFIVPSTFVFHSAYCLVFFKLKISFNLKLTKLHSRRSLNDKCGIEIINYVDAAMKYEMVDKFNEREKIMDFLSTHIIRFINAKYSYRTDKNKWRLNFKRAASYICFWTGKNFGNYLLILYSFCKLLYLTNVIGQLFVIGILLGIQNYHRFGFEMIQNMKNGTDFNQYFPKVSHCDFKIRFFIF